MSAARAEVSMQGSFLDAIENLEPQEQGRVMTALGQLRRDPTHTSLSLERLRGDGDLWSARASQDLRLILYQDVGGHWIALHADRHDPAYAWAERKNIGRHPKTGVLQVIETEVRTIVDERIVPRFSTEPLFAPYDPEYLLQLGVPEALLRTLRELRSEEDLLTFAEHVPADVADRLLDLADGKTVVPPVPLRPDEPMTAREDLRYLFYVAEGEEDLARVLRAPMERWITFLHPSQRAQVVGTFSGPVKITGGAGTGKTVVALHRARHLARAGHRVLLTSFVTTLTDHLGHKLSLLCHEAERARITVSTVLSEALRLALAIDPDVYPLHERDFEKELRRQAERHAPELGADLVVTEWRQVIERQALTDWDGYRAASRTGRGNPLRVAQRLAVWRAFDAARDKGLVNGARTWTDLCALAVEALETGAAERPYEAVIVDELQDLTMAQLQLVRALSAEHPENLMLVGDAGQRIFGRGFSLSALGIPVRGRSSILRVNYRSTHEIRRAADRVLGDVVDDMDGETESRTGTHSLFHGPEPRLLSLEDAAEEQAHVVEQVRRWIGGGIEAGAIGVFARRRKEAAALEEALEASGIRAALLREDAPPDDGAQVLVGTMHRAKGLEFKAVVVAGCGEATFPPSYVARIDDPHDREEALRLERHLLYVAMTRARDELCLTYVGAPSTFLAPLHRETSA